MGFFRSISWLEADQERNSYRSQVAPQQWAPSQLEDDHSDEVLNTRHFYTIISNTSNSIFLKLFNINETIFLSDSKTNFVDSVKQHLLINDESWVILTKKPESKFKKEKLLAPITQTEGGARDVMVIVAGIGHGDMSSNPGRVWLHLT